MYRFCIQQIKRYVGAIERPGALGDDPSTQEELTELEIDIKGARLLLQGLLRQTNPGFYHSAAPRFRIAAARYAKLHLECSAKYPSRAHVSIVAAAWIDARASCCIFSDKGKYYIYVLGLVGDTRFVTAALFACCPIRAVVCQLNYFGCGCQEVLAQRHHNLDLAFTRALKMWESGPAQNSPAAKKQKSTAKQRSNSASATTTAQVEVADKTRLYDAQQSHVALASRIEQQSCGRVQFESGQRVSLTDRSK